MPTDDEYTVSLYQCAMPWPLSFAVHMWFVTKYRNSVKRIEIWAPFWLTDTAQSVLVINALSPSQGFRASYFDSIEHPKKRSHVTKVISYSGIKGSIAQKLFTVLEAAPIEYVYRNTYRLWPGPNSNTFIAWVAHQVPEAKIPIPINAFGKNFMQKK